MNIQQIQETARAVQSHTQSTDTRKASTVSGFQNTLSESMGSKNTSLDSIFEKAAATYQVDVNLLKAIARQESNFQTDVVSKAGAAGVMQLMPSTAKALGVSDVMDPEQNIMGGAKLISGLLKKYDGNTQLALAAYNAGSGNVAKYNGIPPFKETQDYVKKVMSYYNTSPDASRINTSTESHFDYEDYLRFLDIYMKLLSDRTFF